MLTKNVIAASAAAQGTFRNLMQMQPWSRPAAQQLQRRQDPPASGYSPDLQAQHMLHVRALRRT